MDMLDTSQAAPAKKDSDIAAKWRKWLTRIEGRKKTFENGWWKQAETASKMYDVAPDAGADSNPFNIIYANTEVLLPSLYSASPRPDVSMRNQSSPDPIARATEAYLTAFIDTNTPGRESFDDSLESSTLSALVPGAGFVRLRVYPGETCPIRTESGDYRDIVWGKAQKWNRVPWVCFIHRMVKEDIVSQFKIPEERQKDLTVETQAQADETKTPQSRDQTLYVYELWIKATKQVVFLCEGWKDILLEDVGDQLQIASFYPTPGPLTLVKKPGGLDPTPIYAYYQNQAEELNRVTVRLNKVLSAIRVRGAYNNMLGDEIRTLLEDTSMENGLVPTRNAMDLQARGFEGHIYFLPLEQLIQVAKELYTARVQIMSVIQQITGLSDIVRGSTVASETATAQDLKNKWGTIRLRRMQRIIQVYVRDLLRITVDIASRVLGEEEWASATQLQFPTSEQKQQAIIALQGMMQQAQQQAAMAQQMGQPPSPPPQPDPKLVAIAQQPSWGEILKVLQDDNGRCYAIDIETASTVDTDATADREEVSEFMGAIAQLFQGLMPLVQMGPSGLEVAKELLIAVCSKFKFGREVKQSIEKLEPPPPNQGDPAAQAKAAREQQQMQHDQALQQMEMAGKQQELAIAKQESDLKLAQMQRDEQVAQAKHSLELDKMAMERQRLPMELEIMALKVVAAKAQAEKARQAPAKSNSRAN